MCSDLNVRPGNQLIECQDCHSLYHLECHKPAVSQREVDDPRGVWYCSKCTKERAKKLASSHVCTAAATAIDKCNSVRCLMSYNQELTSVQHKGVLYENIECSVRYQTQC